MYLNFGLTMHWTANTEASSPVLTKKERFTEKRKAYGFREERSIFSAVFIILLRKETSISMRQSLFTVFLTSAQIKTAECFSR